MKKAEIDLVWKALADSRRRDILDYLKEGPMTTGDLCEQFSDLTRFGVMKHIKVLEEASLITVKWEGRTRWNYFNAVPLKKTFERWITPYQSMQVTGLEKLKNKLEQE
jgi:DNA-binding transcriptional ArsR family regulator